MHICEPEGRGGQYPVLRPGKAEQEGKGQSHTLSSCLGFHLFSPQKCEFYAFSVDIIPLNPTSAAWHGRCRSSLVFSNSSSAEFSICLTPTPEPHFLTPRLSLNHQGILESLSASRRAVGTLGTGRGLSPFWLCGISRAPDASLPLGWSASWPG